MKPVQDDYPIDISFDKLITKLYLYRSSIAHGSSANFSGVLQVLKNKDYATGLIYTILKRVIIQALKEPNLIEVLKRC